MQMRRDTIGGSLLRLALAGAAALFLMASPALAQIMPPGFLEGVPTNDKPAQIQADVLGYDANAGVIMASGNVIMRHMGFVVSGEQLSYNRETGDVDFVGNVTLIDPTGVKVTTESLEVTGGLKQAFLKSLTLTLPDGSQIAAGDVNYDAALRTVLTDTSYSPCGLCVDSKGRKIGWRVKAAKMVVDHETHTTYIESPTLELLGVPVAWLPALWLPDPQTPFLQGLRMPSIKYEDEYGVRLEVPYSVTIGYDTDIIFTPTLFSKQGFLMGVEWVQRHDLGTFQVKASGIYQMDREAFEGTVGDLDWRGALQTSGRFTPIEHWTAGWSYTAFTDAAYLGDYDLAVGKSAVNEVYVEHLSNDFYGELRLQQFNQLGNVDGDDEDGKQAQQGEALPNARFDSVTKLPEGWGQIDITARLLGVNRTADMNQTDTGETFITGYAGQKAHAMLEAGWQTQWIGPAGLVFSPYLGLRGDYAYYNGGSELPSAPEEQTLYTTTPIAALDLRWPLMIKWNDSVHIVEPIGQLVYRGSDETLVGITNDNAQSFVYDDTNLFSFNRFSGSDRQETGSRANVGVHYLANFADGSYIDFLAGQSFHLDGVNAYDTVDGAHTGGSNTGLADDASYIVLGLQGSPYEGLTGSGKLQINPDAGEITRASLNATYVYNGYTMGFDYRYLAADLSIAASKNQQEIGANVAIPIDDYWRLTAAAYWDLEGETWLQWRGGLVYDDGYLMFGASGGMNGPTHESENATVFAATFKIKAPGDISIGF